MKTRISFDAKTLRLLAQPDGFVNPTKAFIEQYGCACDIVNPLIPGFNESWPNGKMGDEDYERAYYALFLECLNSVERSKRVYNFTAYDGEDLEYDITA